MSEQYPVVCWDCRPDLWVGKNVIFAPITTMYCCECRKPMDPLDQPRKSIDDFDWDKLYKENAGNADPNSGGLPGDPYGFKALGQLSRTIFEGRMQEARQAPKNIEDSFRDLLQKELDKKDEEIERLWGLIRRLEKSNQELGEELQRCCNKNSVGWNKNV